MNIRSSSADCYQQCPHKYYHTYENPFSGTSLPPTEALTIGNAVHHWANRFFQSAPHNRTLEQATKIVALSCAEFGLLDIEQIKMVHHHVDNLFRLESPSQIHIIGTEVEFGLNLTPEVYYHGTIDRVEITPNDTYILTDYKTGRQSANHKTQLFRYAMAINSGTKLAFGNIVFAPDKKVEKIKIIYTASPYPEIQTIPISDMMLDTTKTELLAIAKAITKDTKWKPKTSMLCGWCDHISICEKGQRYLAKQADDGMLKETAPAWANSDWQQHRIQKTDYEKNFTQ